MQRVLLIALTMLSLTLWSCSDQPAQIIEPSPSVMPRLAASGLENLDETAQSLSLNSPNFSLKGRIRPSLGKALLNDLEALRAALMDMHDISADAPDINLGILFIEDLEDFLAFSSGEYSGAFYSRGYLGPKIIVNTSNVIADPSRLWEVMYHEYVHHFNSTHLKYKTPLWLNEGLAEYITSFRPTENGDYSFGYTEENRQVLRTLRRYPWKWLPFDAYIRELNRYPIIHGYFGENAKERQAFYYAQSWLLTFWMHHTDEGQRSFERLIVQLDKGEDVRAAFPENMDAILKDYVKNFSPSPVVISPKRPVENKAVDISQTLLSEFDMNARVLLQLAQDRGSKTRETVMKALEGSLEEAPPEYDAHILAAKALNHFRAGDFVSARRVFLKAFATAKDPDVLRVNAVANIHMTRVFIRGKNAQNELAEDAIKASLAARRSDLDLDIYRLSMMGQDKQYLSKSQRGSLTRILESGQHKRSPMLSLNLVYPLIGQQEFDVAEGIVDRARIWGGASSTRLARMKEDIELNRKYSVSDE